MPVFQLENAPYFPPPRLAEASGLLAVGGDLGVERLVQAYAHGIFPWFSEDSPILWWSPDPRMVLYPERFKVSKSLRNTLRKDTFKVQFDRAFGKVIHACARVPRKDQPGTWITPGMIQAYIDLHEAGYAHSVEVYHGGDLVGGLYGVVLGKFFFGESMFHTRTDASKIVLTGLARYLEREGFVLLDCQVPNPHLFSMGACQISRADFLEFLAEGGLGPEGVADKIRLCCLSFFR